MFFAVLRASLADPEKDLPLLVPDKGYQEAFLNLSRNLAPTGKTFDSLEIRDASAPAVEPLFFQPASRRQLNTALRNIRPPRQPEPTDEVVEIRGILRGLHLDQDWIEVVEADPLNPTRIHETGDVLDDAVGPMVNHRVVVTASRRRGRLVYQDIQTDE
jgi:hypothetical protein